MTMIARLSPDTSPEIALTREEIQLIDAMNDKKKNKTIVNIETKTLS
jgi:hypothetical protein